MIQIQASFIMINSFDINYKYYKTQDCSKID